jgi:hypothetical protein
MLAPPGVPEFGGVAGLLGRGPRGGVNLVAGQALQRKVRNLSYLCLGIVEHSEQGGNNILAPEVFQTQNGIHAVGNLGGMKIVEERLGGPCILKEAQASQDFAAARLGTLLKHLHQGWKELRVRLLLD